MRAGGVVCVGDGVARWVGGGVVRAGVGVEWWVGVGLGRWVAGRVGRREVGGGRVCAAVYVSRTGGGVAGWAAPVVTCRVAEQAVVAASAARTNQSAGRSTRPAYSAPVPATGQAARTGHHLLLEGAASSAVRSCARSLRRLRTSRKAMTAITATTIGIGPQVR